MERVKELMDFNGNITKRNNGDIYLLTICSKAIKDDLLKLGITKRKSLTIEFPSCPSEYLPHFVRGVIDGDGHVAADGNNVTVTSGSYQFAQGLLSVFNLWSLKSRINVQTTQNDKPIYRIMVVGKASVKKLAEIIYQDCEENFVKIKKAKMTQMISKENLHVPARVKFRTNISFAILKELENIASKNNTYINYLLETGMKKLLGLNDLILTKRKLSHRIQYKTTYNVGLLEKVKTYADEHGIHINDFIEYSADYINIEEAVKEGNRHRKN